MHLSAVSAHCGLGGVRAAGATPDLAAIRQDGQHIGNISLEMQFKLENPMDSTNVAQQSAEGIAVPWLNG